MGRLEREARDIKVAEQERRMTRGIYGQLPYQVFMVHAIKAPMLESLAALVSSESGNGSKFKALLRLRQVLKDFDKFPEPTIENTWHPNSHRLIQLRDEFFKHCVGLAPERLKFMRTVINFVIIIYDYDRPYRDMMDWAWDYLKGLGWTPRGAMDLIGKNWPWWVEDVS